MLNRETRHRAAPSIETERKIPMADAGFIGVSICSHYFSRENVRAIAEAAKVNFARFLFLVADDPQAYTFTATKELPFREAWKRARLIGAERSVSISRTIRQTGASNCEVMIWRDLLKLPTFRHVRSAVKWSLVNDPAFATDVRELLNQRFGCSLATERRDWVYAIAVRYVLEELAAMIFLLEKAQPSWPLQVFPAPIPKALVRCYTSPPHPDLALHGDLSGYRRLAIAAGCVVTRDQAILGADDSPRMVFAEESERKWRSPLVTRTCDLFLSGHEPRRRLSGQTPGADLRAYVPDDDSAIPVVWESVGLRPCAGRVPRV